LVADKIEPFVVLLHDLLGRISLKSTHLAVDFDKLQIIVYFILEALEMFVVLFPLNITVN